MHCSFHAAAWVLGLGLVGAQALAGDRPYLSTHSAAAEEDDDAVWSVESWSQRVGAVRMLSLAPEYAFDPTTSLQLELSSSRDRGADQTTQSAEIEFKHLFNHIERDGYGWGLVASQSLDKAPGGGWRRGGVTLKLPFTLSLWERDGALHLNAGLAKEPGTRSANLLSAAIEYRLTRRSTLFAETAREGSSTLLHGGVRWWLKKEKFALDLSWQRVRAPGESDRGVVFGLGWYDL